MASPHASQTTLGAPFIYRDRAGRIAPVVSRIASEFARLRAMCEAEGLPNDHFDSPEWFIRHVIREHSSRLNCWDDPTLVLDLKDRARGLAPGNISVSHEPAGAA